MSENKYEAKPQHLLFTIALFCAGVLLGSSNNENLMIMSIAFYTSSFGSYVIIISNAVLIKYIEYWKEVNRFSDLMLKNNNPELWKALGFKMQEGRTTTRMIDRSNGHLGLYKEVRETYPVSPDALKIISHGILNEGLTFSEKEWVTDRKVLKSTAFRKFQNMLELKGSIKPNNKDNRKLGFSFTKKGIDLLKEWQKD